MSNQTYKFKTTPFKHQVGALKHLISNGRGMLHHEMGLGKTKSTIDFVGAAHVKWGTQRALVLTRVGVIGSWQREIPLHGSGKHVVRVQDFGRERPLKEGAVTWRLSNYEALLNPERWQWFKNWLAEDPHSVIVLDESHMIKNPNAQRSKKTYGLTRVSGHIVLLSGTPIAKNPLDLFMQFKCLDENVFGTRFAHFKRRYVVMGGYGGHTVEGWQNLDELSRLIAPLTHRARKEDCLDLPEKTHNIVPIEIDGKTAKAYDALAEDAVVELEGGRMTAAIVLTRMLRLAQITGGWAKTDADPENGIEAEYEQLGTEKLEALKDLLERFEEEGKDRAVVMCRFINEVRECAIVAHKLGWKLQLLHGGVKQGTRTERIAEFQQEGGVKQIFIAQVDTGSLGITLTRASDMVFFSHPQSFSTFEQACDRIHRIGQKDACGYYHLIATGTVDEVTYQSLQDKKSLATTVSDHPDIIRRKRTHLKGR